MKSEVSKKQKQILVVEDNPDILESLDILLKHNHYEVKTMSEGGSVKEYVLKNVPDLIMMDVMIPKPDGLTLCNELKSDSQTRSIPIILLSAKAQKAEIDRGLSHGADRYLTKPYNNDDVLRAVAELLIG